MEMHTLVSRIDLGGRQGMTLGANMSHTMSMVWCIFSGLVGVGHLLLAPLLGVLLSTWLLHTLVKQDYKPFVAAGSGASPEEKRRDLWNSLINVFRLRQPRIAPALPSSLWLQRGCLESLPTRQGPRPEVVGTTPQRQLTQLNPNMFEELFAVIASFARTYPNSCYLGRSSFENRNAALFSQCDFYTRTRYRGEICHAHPADGSMHLILHPADVKTVVEAGWGERHPLARTDWWWQLLAPVPAGYTMVYNPREKAELEHIKKIIHAAVWWVGGMDSQREEESHG